MGHRLPLNNSRSGILGYKSGCRERLIKETIKSELCLNNTD
jgi:hypothetical protein